VVKGQFKSKVVSEWRKEINVNICHPFHLALEKKAISLSDPLKA
jgi:hypothetical protein